jgi:hypothetical protein
MLLSLRPGKKENVSCHVMEKEASMCKDTLRVAIMSVETDLLKKT